MGGVVNLILTSCPPTQPACVLLQPDAPCAHVRDERARCCVALCGVQCRYGVA